MTEFHYVKLTSAATVVQTHVRGDGRYMLLPRQDPSPIMGWTIYDVQTGEMFYREKEGYLPFRTLAEAKSFITKELVQ